MSGEVVAWTVAFVGLVTAMMFAMWLAAANPGRCEERLLDTESMLMVQRSCPAGTRVEHVEDQWVCRCPVEVTP